MLLFSIPHNISIEWIEMRISKKRKNKFSFSHLKCCIFSYQVVRNIDVIIFFCVYIIDLPSIFLYKIFIFMMIKFAPGNFLQSLIHMHDERYSFIKQELMCEYFLLMIRMKGIFESV